MANQNLQITVESGNSLSFPNRSTGGSTRLVNHDSVSTAFPNGIHMVMIGSKSYVIENSSNHHRFSVRLPEGFKYVSKKGLAKAILCDMEVFVTENATISLPSTTLLQNLGPDGVISVTTPECHRAIYMGQIDGATFADLCKAVMNCDSRRILVDVKGYIKVLSAGRIMQTLFMKECIDAKLVICSNDKYLHIDGNIVHDLQTRKSRTLQKATLSCFSPDSRKIAYYIEPVVHVLDMESYQIIGTITTAGNVKKIAFYSDDNYLAVGKDCRLVLIEIRTGQLYHSHDTNSYMHDFAVATNGLIYFKHYHGIKSWDQTKKWFAQKTLFEDYNTAPPFAISGKYIALLHWRYGKNYLIRIFDNTSRKSISIIDTGLNEDDFDGNGCSNMTIFTFSSDQRHIMVTYLYKNKSWIYNVATGFRIAELKHPHKISAVQ